MNGFLRKKGGRDRRRHFRMKESTLESWVLQRVEITFKFDCILRGDTSLLHGGGVAREIVDENFRIPSLTAIIQIQ